MTDPIGALEQQDRTDALKAYRALLHKANNAGSLDALTRDELRRVADLAKELGLSREDVTLDLRQLGEVVRAQREAADAEKALGPHAPAQEVREAIEAADAAIIEAVEPLHDAKIGLIEMLDEGEQARARAREARNRLASKMERRPHLYGDVDTRRPVTQGASVNTGAVPEPQAKVIG